MYDFIRGKVASASPTRIVIDVGGVGYLLEVPLSTYEALPKKGDAQVWVQLHVREDALRLFGFATVEERSLFNLLQSVSGVGPTVGLNILSRARVAEICDAIVREDIAYLKSLKGVGPKTAARLVTELKEKAAQFSTGAQATPRSAAGAIEDDAIQALEILGYPTKSAMAAVHEAAETKAASTVGELVRAALKRLS